MQRAKIPAANEPPGLLPSDNELPDGVTSTPWKQGKCLVWDVIMPVTYTNHICNDSHVRRVRSRQVSCLQNSKGPEHLADPPVHTHSNRNRLHTEQPNKRMHQRTWETYYHCHREVREIIDIFQQISVEIHAVFQGVIHHRHGLLFQPIESLHSQTLTEISKPADFVLEGTQKQKEIIM